MTNNTDITLQLATLFLMHNEVYDTNWHYECRTNNSVIFVVKQFATFSNLHNVNVTVFVDGDTVSHVCVETHHILNTHDKTTFAYRFYKCLETLNDEQTKSAHLQSPNAPTTHPTTQRDRTLLSQTT